MTLGDAGLTFVSVFVAALLAFYLDGLRERRATEKWVREYLGFWRGWLGAHPEERATNEAYLDRIDAALADWLDPGRSGRQPRWAEIDTINVNNPMVFTPLLLSTGVSVVRPDLLQRLFRADATAPALKDSSEWVSRFYEDHIRPLVLARIDCLDALQRRAVETYRSEFAQFSELTRQYQGMLRAIHEELAARGF